MQTQPYRAYAQPHVPQRSPANQRRGGMGPVVSANNQSSLAMNSAQIAQQQQAQGHANELAKRRSRKPTDKNLPDGIEDFVVDGDCVQRYKDLRDVERQLDATMIRKRMDVIDNANRPTVLTKTLRIWISNTVEDQVWQSSSLNVDAFDFTPSLDASYRVKIEGRLLDENEDESEDDKDEHGDDKHNITKSAHTANGNPDSGVEMAVDEREIPDSRPSKSSPTRPRFSHFFKSLHVDFERARLRNGTEQSVEWKKPDPHHRGQTLNNSAASADFDELTFKRNGDENVNIVINLVRQETPERYQLSPELADIVDMTEATQQEAVMGLWEYIRFSGLQEDEEKRNFRCDELLRKVVRGAEVGHIPALNDYVIGHLRPLAPISLPYTIRVDEGFHKDPQPTVYDVQLRVDDPIKTILSPLINNPKYVDMLKEVNALDEQLARLIQTVSISKAKQSFFKAMSEDPANFVRNWLSSQKRDLDLITGESKGGIDPPAGDEWRRGGRSGLWTSSDAKESVNILLSKQR